MPPPPDVAGVSAGSCRHVSHKYDSSRQHDEGLDEDDISGSEGRGRFDRSEPGRVRSWRSPDCKERRDEYRDSFYDESCDLRAREQPTDTIILKASFRCAMSSEAVLFVKQRTWSMSNSML